ncbi:hypothetical protein JCM19239_6286 [Vibrio variabilis]|uniref:Lipoprotein n=1 Tax=Vibrio variabilis TaxID=990271 RepID=A0ABQ0J9F2_9VIBR|nr:hypothetical protein JCM19239_6286 [Vibrio variabilis]
MKYLIPLASLAILVGCNSSNDNSDSELPQSLPPTHLPGDLVPERPHPDAGEPGHLPGDLVPDRLPIAWYEEVSARFGMTVESLDAVCRYKGEHPQMDIHVSCNWANDELTIIYFASRGIGEREYFYDHAFNWIVSDEQIVNGKLWPGVNHNAVGLEDNEVHIEPDGARYNIGYGCDQGTCDGIVHTLNIHSNNNHVISDGTPFYGMSDFDISTYQQSEKFFFNIDFTLENGDVHTNTLHLLDDFPSLIYDVLAPAFGY